MNINGCEFEFHPVTIIQQAVIQKRSSKTPLWLRMFGKKVVVPNPKDEKNPFIVYSPYVFEMLFAKLTWRRLCRIMFEMDFKWKYLHIHPKELTFNRMLEGVPEEIKASFFAFYRDAVKEAGERSKPFTDLFRKYTI